MFSTTRRKPSRASAADEPLDAALQRLRQLVDGRLAELVPSREDADGLARAMHAAVMSPGKRLRPALVFLAAEMFGRDARQLADVGCAVELVHAASLVLDDLPSMDDAPTRRGQPAVHVAFGESTAILAAFALLARAETVLSHGLTSAGVAPAHREDLLRSFADVVESLCRGQMLDLQLGDTDADLDRLESIHARKTGALFELAVRLGGACASRLGSGLMPLLSYARNLGLAFQVSDDLLDAEGDPAHMGKPAGRDAALGRSTFVSVFGADGARTLCADLTHAAREALAPLGGRAVQLLALADYVRDRTL